MNSVKTASEMVEVTDIHVFLQSVRIHSGDIDTTDHRHLD